jgi:hypothetical protein
MKEVINLNGKKIEVSVDTPVVTKGGIHYLHTPEEEAEIASRESEYKAEQDATEYKRGREQGYGSVQDQLDQIYWDQVNGTTTWVDHITSVKQQHPKPTK